MACRKLAQTKLLRNIINRSYLNSIRSCNAFDRQHSAWCINSVGVPSISYKIANNHNHNHKRYFETSKGLNSEIIPFKLSDIGEGIGEVVVKEWFVSVGDKVAQFDSICEVQSDKASVTITSRYDGIVTKIYYQVDDVAKVGNPLVDIETESSSAEQHVDTDVTDNVAIRPYSSDTDESEREVVSFSSSSSKVLTTPAVRMLAMKNNINLKDVKGSGKEGRILKEDVFKYMEEKSNKREVIKEPKKQPSKDIPVTSVFKEVDKKYLSEDKIEPIKGMRKAMARTMTKALNIPHFGLSEEIDMTQLVTLRATLKAVAEERKVQLSYMPFFIKAASLALSHFPIINASVDEKCENITMKAAHNIGVAMDTRDGLLVPNIKHVEDLTVYEIAKELNRLHELGKNGKLGSADLTGGTFTLSNIGSVGGLFGIPVIMPPEVAIGAIGRIREVPKFGSDGVTLVKAHVLKVVWSADHRVIDGAAMCRFSNMWKKFLETPVNMMIDMK